MYKRILFSLLTDGKRFFLSRNFRLQAVGDLNWLKENYGLSRLTSNVDELIICNVSREESTREDFRDLVSQMVPEITCPLTLGGLVDSVEVAAEFFDLGADKVLINTAGFETNGCMSEIASIYGEQSIVFQVDVSGGPGNYVARTESGTKPHSLSVLGDALSQNPMGEVILNSIGRDGTGSGLDFQMLEILPTDFRKPVLLAGGVGKSEHIVEALDRRELSGVATSNLFAFIGDGMRQTRIEANKSEKRVANFQAFN